MYKQENSPLLKARFCAINTSAEIFYLDHICPLASLLNIPLIVSEEKNAGLSAKYYPEVDLHYVPDLPFHLKELADRFDALIGCDYWLPELKNLFFQFHQKKMRLILCPHGQSDKGYKAPSLAPYAYHDEVLLYGDLMRQMLKELQLLDSIPSLITVGNFRYHYYQRHKLRFRKIVEEEIFSKLNPAHKTLLYAPTWNDLDGSTTFFDSIEKLIREIPNNWNLIVKLHPLLPARDPALFYRLSVLEEKREGFLLIHEFPLVYPILEKIDAYLGDYSSIGYDVLAFSKPMFFLEKTGVPIPRLHSCGRILDNRANFFDTIERGLATAEEYHGLQKALYAHAFAEDGSIYKLLKDDLV